MRSKFCEQTSVASQRQFSRLHHLNHYRQLFGKKIRIATIALLLGLSAGCWATAEVFAPQIAQAETARVDLSLDRQSNESYEALVNRAEVSAKEAVENSFQQKPQVTDVSVTVMGHHLGSIAPVLSVNVNRSQWQSKPEVKSWSNYFFSARSLLGLDPNAANTNNSNQSNTSASNTYRSSQSSFSNTTPRRNQSSSGNNTFRPTQSSSGTNSNTFRPTQSSSGTSSTQGQTQTPPIPGSVRQGYNNSFGGQPTNSTSGQSGNSLSPTGISSPQPISPSSIEQPNNLQNSTSPNGSSSGSGITNVNSPNGNNSGVSIPSITTPQNNSQNLTSPNNNNSNGVLPSTTNQFNNP